MARFVDLEEDDEQGSSDLPVEQRLRHGFQNMGLKPSRTSDGGATRASSNGTANGGHDDSRPRTSNSVTRAFQCYPVVCSIVSCIDLNTLDSLARASFYIHQGLLQNRQVLVSSTLRCTNEHVPVDRDETLRYRARAGNWFYMEDGRNYNGKSGHCARDLVGPCRRCGHIICRNCAIKPPAPVALRERHRRLCPSCATAPIATLAKPPLDAHLPLTAEPVQRTICKCESEGVWLCQPCGRSIRGADHEYQRIWRWRSHYGEVLGGLGTGIGDGDRGVICGRDENCCAAKEREQEVDCDAQDAKDSNVSSWSDLLSASPSMTTPPLEQYPNHGGPAMSSTPPTHGPLGNVIRAEDRTPSPQLRSGYQRHEIEGIGGVVKRKLVRMVRVGACVPEYEDERGVGRTALDREVRGDLRSWCGWCWRVIPGRDDLENDGYPEA